LNKKRDPFLPDVPLFQNTIVFIFTKSLLSYMLVNLNAESVIILSATLYF